MNKLVLTSLFCSALVACSNPQSGPDKTLGGAVLGAGWGAGAGAIVGNNLPGSPSGEGAAVGAGLGMASGMMAGMGYDLIESTQIKQEKELDALEMQNTTNTRQLQRLQRKLDTAVTRQGVGGIYQVYFDADATNLRSGAVANLETIAESVKANPAAYTVNVVGHSDDAGTPEYNEKVAEARARTVAGYLAERGVSMNHIKVTSQGSKQPVASNASPIGRQLNRRVDVFVTQK